MNKDGKTLIVFVLDETGSMESVRDQTISGFNEFLDSQENKVLGETRVTLVKFNSDRIDIPYSDTLIQDVPPLSRATYMPDTTTPLYDAIARAILDTETKMTVPQKVLKKIAGHAVAFGPIVLFVIMTDGLENASREYKREQVFGMITDKKKLGWGFVFLGANQDSWAAADKVGIPQGSTVNYAHGATKKAFAGVAMATIHYRASASLLAASSGSLPDYQHEMQSLSDSFWAGEKDVEHYLESKTFESKAK